MPKFLFWTYLISALLAFDPAEGSSSVYDERTLVMVKQVVARPLVAAANVAAATFTGSNLDVRSLPGLMSSMTRGRRLTESAGEVEACLQNDLAVDTLSYLGVQTIRTLSDHCRASTEQVKQYLDAAKELLNIDYVCEPNQILSLDPPEVCSEAVKTFSNASLNEPIAMNQALMLHAESTDPLRSNQYYLDAIQASEASSLLQSTSREVKEVILAIIDSGVDLGHEDIRNVLWTDGNGNYGRNFLDGTNNVQDDSSHGTICAGIAAAHTNNGVGISGVGIKVKIMALKILDSNGKGPLSNALSAIEYALQHGASVSSHSYSAETESRLLKSAMQKAADMGHMMVLAAGNDNLDSAQGKRYPCAYSSEVDNSLCVGSTQRANVARVAQHSNFGPYVDIGAPGEAILSTSTGQSSSCPANKCYVLATGTSMATPQVAGVSAMLATLSLTAQQIKEIVIQTTSPLDPTDTKKLRQGAGLVNANLAVAQALGTAPGTTRSPGSGHSVNPGTVSLAIVSFLCSFNWL